MARTIDRTTDRYLNCGKSKHQDGIESDRLTYAVTSQRPGLKIPLFPSLLLFFFSFSHYTRIFWEHAPSFTSFSSNSRLLSSTHRLKTTFNRLDTFNYSPHAGLPNLLHPLSRTFFPSSHSQNARSTSPDLWERQDCLAQGSIPWSIPHQLPH